jgi:hypothetical protein
VFCYMPEVSLQWQDSAGLRAYGSIIGQHVFEMATELFPSRSISFGMLKSGDPFEEPLMGHDYLLDPLGLLVLVESSRLGREAVIKGATPNILSMVHCHPSRCITRIHKESRVFHA